MRKILTEIPAFFVIFISIVPKGLLNCQLSTVNSYKYQFIYTMVVIIPYFSSENKGYKLNVV